MPVVFIGHGSPMNIVEENQFVEGWRKIAEELPRPKAILCISAHWYAGGQIVSTAENPETIYDFWGFPKELYEKHYPAPGAPEIASQTMKLLGADAAEDNMRGYDHGAWAPLHIMFPKADIPIFQISVNRNNTPQESLEVGRKLRSLREEEILIFGSGNIVHNLQLVNWGMSGVGYPWANAFDQYIKDAVIAGDSEAVVHYENVIGKEQKAFYSRDHYDPLLYCMGATDHEDIVSVYNDVRDLGALSMTSYVWHSNHGGA